MVKESSPSRKKDVWPQFPEQPLVDAPAVTPASAGTPASGGAAPPSGADSPNPPDAELEESSKLSPQQEKLTLIARVAAALAAAAALGFAAFAAGLGLLAVCLYAIGLLLIFSRFMLSIWIRPLRCTRELSADVVEIGTPVHVTTVINNSAPWPILWMYAEDSLPTGFARQGVTRRLLFLPPRRSFHLTYMISLTRRGCHQIGPLITETGDVFGLFRKSTIHPDLDYVTVLPGYDVLEQVRLGEPRKLGDLTSMRSIFEDPTRLRGIREYRRGDPLNRIHWKSSARHGALRTKIFDPIIELAATVVLDFHADSWKTSRGNREGFRVEDEGAELACTICNYLAEGNWKFGLLSNGRDPLGLPGITLAQARASESLREALDAARRPRKDSRLAPLFIPARSSMEQFRIVRENIGRIALSDGLPIGSLLLDTLPHINREQALVLVTGDISEETQTAILRARELGYRAMVFLVGNIQAHDRVMPAFLGAGVELFSMDSNWRLREIATGRRYA